MDLPHPRWKGTRHISPKARPVYPSSKVPKPKLKKKEWESPKPVRFVRSEVVEPPLEPTVRGFLPQISTPSARNFRSTQQGAKKKVRPGRGGEDYTPHPFLEGDNLGLKEDTGHQLPRAHQYCCGGGGFKPSRLREGGDQGSVGGSRKVRGGAQTSVGGSSRVRGGAFEGLDCPCGPPPRDNKTQYEFQEFKRTGKGYECRWGTIRSVDNGSGGGGSCGLSGSPSVISLFRSFNRNGDKSSMTSRLSSRQSWRSPRASRMSSRLTVDSIYEQDTFHDYDYNPGLPFYERPTIMAAPRWYPLFGRTRYHHNLDQQAVMPIQIVEEIQQFYSDNSQILHDAKRDYKDAMKRKNRKIPDPPELKIRQFQQIRIEPKQDPWTHNPFQIFVKDFDPLYIYVEPRRNPRVERPKPTVAKFWSPYGFF